MKAPSGTPLEQLLTLSQAAARLQWSVRTLKGRLLARGIGPIGRGRLARITEQDFERFIEAERQRPPVPVTEADYSSTGDPAFDARMRSYYRRRSGQLNRKKSNKTL